MKKLSFLLVGLLPSIMAAQPSGPRPAVPAGLRVWVTGAAADVVVDQSATGPAILLMGGGGEVDEAFAERAYPVINGGDIVVIRASGSNGYNDYLFELPLAAGVPRPNSVETMLINSRTVADTAYVEWVLAGAEMIWMAGGDQSDYTEFWRSTKVQAGLQAAYDRGAVIGGTSAGMAVLADLIYDPGAQGSLTSLEGLSNPYHPNLVLSARLLNADVMNHVLTDTHFRNRDRMGRSLAMLAHARQENRLTSPGRVLCLSENSSLFIDRNGLGTVDIGSRGDALYALVETPATQRTRVVAGQPLQFGPVNRYRLVDDQTIDLKTWQTDVAPMVLSVDGGAATPFTPADPYADAPTVTPTPTTTSWLIGGQ